jgi:hypothetical protein
MTQRFFWLRLGDHRAETDRAMAACAAEHGGVTVGQPTVIARADRTGQQFTSLEASGDWWLTYMRVRGIDWVGPASADQVKDILMPRTPPSA